MRCTVLAATAVLIITSAALAQREYGFDNTKPSNQPYLSAKESIKRMKVASGFEVKLFAAEPDVINPIAFTIDEKGRVWVLENFEYPSKTPPGKAPRDRIIILEDTDGDGKADKRTVFAEGKDFPVPKERAEKGLGAFDLASGLEVGHGGVFVGAPPYLWFIENKNDKPGKFEVLLKGFGSHDTHETLNTFQWGPDGRLYGLHGVFTQSEVQTRSPPAPLPRNGGEGGNASRPSPAGGEEGTVLPSPPPGGRGAGGEGVSAPVRMNAAVWRYDVHSRKFEIFAEGTSNPWGMDFDANGNCFLACCVIPHLFHIVPGGIYIRQAGSSYNPYAYGYMKEICDHTHHKESGWAHAGLLCLDGEHVPEPYRGSVLMGSIHGCSIKRDVLRKNGSSFIASHAEDFLVSGDKNFRPINLRWGPGGDIYVIDWHDQNPCHQAKPDSWDKERGRVYRIQRVGAKTVKAEDLGKKDMSELTRIAINDQRPWWYRTALRLLPDLRPKTPDFDVVQYSDRAGGTARFAADAGTRVRAAWVHDLFASTGTPENYDDPSVRASMIRKMTDDIPGWLESRRVADLPRTERSPSVRLEFACSAARVPDDVKTLPLLHALLQHKEDAGDPMIPQMIWLAYEKQIAKASGVASAPREGGQGDKGTRGQGEKELDWLAANALGNPLITDHILPKVMRRLVATQKPDDLAACVDFIGKVDDWTAKQRSLEGLVEALKGRVIEPPPQWEKLAAALTAMDQNKPVTKLVEQLSVNFKSAAAMKRAYEIAHDLRKTPAERAEAVKNVVLLKHPHALALCISMSRQEGDKFVRLEACRCLAMFDKPEVGREILMWWARYSPEERREMLNVLKSRKEWARQLVDAIGQKKVAREDVHNNIILAIAAFNDRGLNQQIEKVWGQIRTSPPPAELEELIGRMRKFVTEKEGDAERGRKVFEKNCLQCHKYEGKGHAVGPELDGAERSLDYILTNVLDPNRVIGLPYYRKTILLKNGKLVTGLLHAEEPSRLTIKGENAVLEVIDRNDIDMEKTEAKSLMPEGLDKNVTPEELRDLVRYLIRK